MKNPKENPSGQSSGEPSKLIIDESWKEKAQKEKEKLADAAAAAAGQAPKQLPAASFLALVEDLALRVMLSLGQFRDPMTGEVYLDLEAAKYAIDLLGVLEQKTKGNLEPSEEAALKEVLHNLRLTFVHVSKSAAALGAQAAPPEGAPEQKPKEPEKPAPKIIY